MSEPISRRDFLKKASKDTVKEVVETGAKIVPGGQIAKRFLEAGNPSTEFVEQPRKNWWDRFVMRKNEAGK